jgi:Tfp pilus assembly protein PilF
MANGSDQGDASTHNNLGVFYYSKGMYAESIKEFKTALEVDPENPQAQENLRAVNRQTGLFDRSVEAFRKSIQMFPQDAEAHYNPT